MTPIAKVWIDGEVCLAHRACMLLETHVFLENPDDYVPAIAADAAKYFESHRRQIIESVLNCPVGAIYLQFADGTVITADSETSIEQWIDY